MGLAACAPTPEPPSAWTRDDLWLRRAAIEQLPAGSDWRLEEARVRVPLQAADGRLPCRASPGRVRALSTPLGVRLGWTVALGEAPWFSFRPLRPGDGRHCRYRYRVGVRRADGAVTEVASHTVGAEGWPAPAPVEVDLAPWAGTEVELLIQADGGRCRADAAPALWGSPALYGRGPAPPAPGSTERPNVILLSFDALRADVLGAYGRRPSLTPALDRLAAESDLWTWAFASFNGTNPSFASLMTGLYGKDHGIYDHRTPLPAAHATLAELLSAAGYRTGAIVSAQHLGDRNSGLAQGFASYRPGSFSAELAADLAMDWIGRQEGPFFLWLHFFAPHTPHTPPRPNAFGRRPAEPAGLRPVASWTSFRRPGLVRFRHPWLGAHEMLYAGEVAYLDRQVDRLLAFLRRRGLLGTSLLAVLSDHGENLDREPRFRHSGLWDATTRVPLLIRWPGPSRPGRTLPGLAQTLDLFPTILRTLGLDVPPQDGRDLRQWTADPSSGRRLVFAEHMNRRGAMVRSSDYLYMTINDHPSLPAGAYLYDLREDPEEGHNLAGSRPEVEGEMAAILVRWRAERRGVVPEPAAVELSEEERERLRVLGYQDP